MMNDNILNFTFVDEYPIVIEVEYPLPSHNLLPLITYAFITFLFMSP